MQFCGKIVDKEGALWYEIIDGDIEEVPEKRKC